MPKIKVTSRTWQKLSELPVKCIEADHRVALDIDCSGIGWARIASGNDEEVEVEVKFAD